MQPSHNDPAFPHFNQHGEVIHDSAVGLSRLEYFALRIYCATISGPALVEAAKASVQVRESAETLKSKVMTASIGDAKVLLDLLARATGEKQ
jgi:hypothetical protein